MPESYKEDGRPAQQWYWDDWFSAFDVRMCSLGARGLWVDMIGIMWKAEIRGTLTVNGKQIDGKGLAKILGEDEKEVQECLDELEENNVYSRLEDGTIICRRMFKESKRKEDISRIRSKAGKRGAKSKWQKNGKDDGKKMAKMAASSPTPSSTPTPSSKDIVKKRKKIIDYFNKTTGQKRSYSCEETNKLINGRLNDGRTFEDFKHVIDTKTSQWLNDPKMRKFLRPSTLFRPGNFEDYLNEDYEDPQKRKYQPGVNPKKPDSPLPLKEMAEVYKICDKKGIDKGEFYDKAKKVFPIIKTTWEQSDKKPETFVRLVEGVK